MAELADEWASKGIKNIWGNIPDVIEMQSEGGAFTWFRGGGDDRYMTQYILTGIGHLRKLNALAGDDYQRMKTIVDKAIPYLDKKIKEDYDYLLRYRIKLSGNNLGYLQVQYLYLRSFFPEYKIPAASQTAYTYYTGQARKFWLSNSRYMQAMIALALHRSRQRVAAVGECALANRRDASGFAAANPVSAWETHRTLPRRRSRVSSRRASK